MAGRPYSFYYYYCQWLYTNLSTLHFLCEANRRMPELRDNEAQWAVSKLCFCNTSRNAEKRKKHLLLLFVCWHVIQTREWHSECVRRADQLIVPYCCTAVQNWIPPGSSIVLQVTYPVWERQNDSMILNVLFKLKEKEKRSVFFPKHVFTQLMA